MIIIIESAVLCLIFTLMVYLMSRDPIKTLYNYPPKIQERVKSLPQPRDRHALDSQGGSIYQRAGNQEHCIACGKIESRCISSI